MNKTDKLTSKLKHGKVQELGVLIVLIVICVILSVVSSNFLNFGNIINIIRQFSEISIVAAGMTIVLISGDIDLSVGSTYGLAAAVAAYILAGGGNPVVAILAAVLIGSIVGIINGFFVTKFELPAFIVTLATMQIVRGGSYVVTGGWPISSFANVDNIFFAMGEDTAGIIPNQILIMIVLNIVLGLFLAKTKFGFQIYAVGGNQNASRLAGINNRRVRIGSFVISGICSAIAGMIGLAYLQSVNATAGTGREMDAVAAAVIGGTSMSGGKGSILGTLIGAAIIGVVRNGMILLGVQAYYQDAFIGIIILLAVLLDTFFKRTKSR